MDETGLFSLGVFVGSLSTIGVKFTDSQHDWKLTLGVILSSTLAGVAVMFAKRFKNEALGCYPLGLVIGLVWNYMHVATDYIGKGDTASVALGVLQIMGTVIFTVLAAFVVGVPAIRYVQQLWASGHVKP